MPDLLLLDISMPELDGWALCRVIRERGHTALPIIIVSANAFDMVAGRAEFPCHDDFVVKPVSMLELLAKIKLRLGIDWIAQATTVAPVAAVTRIPPAAELSALLELGSIGYTRGILDRLEQLVQQDAGYAAFAEPLRALVKSFRLNDYSLRLKELLRHDIDPLR
jgi:CheY-like chemotaxis protein